MFVKRELKKLCDEIGYKFSTHRGIVYPQYNFPQGFYIASLKEIRIYNWFTGGPLSYFVGLHELGHAHFSHVEAVRKDSDIEKQQELEAWEWALQNRKINKIEPKVWEMIVVALRSYGIEHNRILKLLDYG